MRTSRTAQDSPRASGVAQIDSYPYSNRIGAAGCCGGLSIAAVGSTGFHSAYSAVILLAHGTERWMPRRMRCRRVYIERRAECTGSRRYRRHFESWNLANSLDSNASRRLDLCEAAFPPLRAAPANHLQRHRQILCRVISTLPTGAPKHPRPPPPRAIGASAWTARQRHEPRETCTHTAARRELLRRATMAPADDPRLHRRLRTTSRLFHLQALPHDLARRRHRHRRVRPYAFSPQA